MEPDSAPPATNGKPPPRHVTVQRTMSARDAEAPLPTRKHPSKPKKIAVRDDWKTQGNHSEVEEPKHSAVAPRERTTTTSKALWPHSREPPGVQDALPPKREKAVTADCNHSGTEPSGEEIRVPPI
ncbi:hypothetical protein BWQ96_03291 [Gracilariopsis chorda]|uniref:Uncharacterized protein n=1 Tax=Gracilariopsis chorda TaxID=448386 RepID=A0A2V3IY13_9FLOR|nr:hypothetical protein BWQ96_03291 [Gracilariopsis chorda]|eukprot:PXF46953.1 hypothetical protein BWQ96_03291 [Gracilariopsis chorda]